MNQAATPLPSEPWANAANFLPHLQVMMGPYGLYEHATNQVPLLREGYCTDDNARAIQVLIHLQKSLSSAHHDTIEALITKAWQFLIEAHRASGNFYNLRSAEGEWTEQDISDDMYARIIRALVTVIEHGSHPERKQQTQTMLAELLQQAGKLTAPRALAEICIALAEVSEDEAKNMNVQSIVEQSARKLLRLWHDNATKEWPWFESKLVYSNALLPHGLLAAKKYISTPDLDVVVEQSTHFLLKSTIRDGVFVPIGSEGWYPQGGVPSTENQQPIEAGTMLDFLVDFESVFPGKVASNILISPYVWFFGANTGKVMLANRDIGASYDGLFAKGPNKNYGAESMLAYLWSEIRVRDLPKHIQAEAFTMREQLLEVAS